MNFAKFSILSLLAFFAMSSSASASIVFFDLRLDWDRVANTSGTTPYAATLNGGGGTALAGSGVHLFTGTQTYSFANSGTGIQFSFDVDYQQTGGSSFFAATSGRGGIGDEFIDVGETASLTLSNVQVDLTGYNSGSLSGITNPVVAASGVGFDQVRFDRLDADESWIVNGTTGVLGDQNVTPGNIGESDTVADILAGLNSSTYNITVANTGAASNTPNQIRFNDIRYRVAINIQQAAVPEPSSLMMMLSGCGLLALRRKR